MKSDFTVLLIGGSSATGKSTLARQLAEHYKIPLTEVDDVRIVLQSVLDDIKNPDLFTFLNNPDYLEKFKTDQFVKKLIDVGKEVWKPLNVLIDKHIICNEPAVFEGDGIIPEFLAKRNRDKIKAIFLYDDLENLKKRIVKRDRRGASQTADKEAEFSYAVGQEFKRQAEQNGLMVIKVSPVDTLLERVLKTLD